MTFNLNSLFSKIYSQFDVPPIPKLIPEIREEFEKYKYSHTINDLLNVNLNELNLDEEERNQKMFNYVDKTKTDDLINVIYCVCINKYILYQSNKISKDDNKYQIINDLESMILKFHLVKVCISSMKDFNKLIKHDELTDLFTLTPALSNYKDFKKTVNEIYQHINKYLTIKPEYIYLQKLCIYCVSILMKDYLNYEFDEYMIKLNETIQFMISVLSDVDNFIESINLSKYSVVNLNNIYTNIELNQKIDNSKTVKSNLTIIKWLAQKILKHFNKIDIYIYHQVKEQFELINVYDLKIDKFINVMYHLFHFIKYSNDLLINNDDNEFEYNLNEYDKNKRYVCIKYYKLLNLNEIKILNEIIDNIEYLDDFENENMNVNDEDENDKNENESMSKNMSDEDENINKNENESMSKYMSDENENINKNVNENMSKYMSDENENKLDDNELDENENMSDKLNENENINMNDKDENMNDENENINDLLISDVDLDELIEKDLNKNTNFTLQSKSQLSKYITNFIYTDSSAIPSISLN